jgi:signal transduction histidine kinase
VADGQVLAGVAAGIAARLGVDVLIVRLALVVLATAGGAGGVLYVAAWLWLPAESSTGAVPRRTPSARHALAVACLVAGTLLLLRAAGAWWSDSLTWSIALAAAGSGVVWTQASEGERAQWRAALAKAVGERALPDAALMGPIRPVIGACLVLAGVVTFFLSSSVIAGDAGALIDVLVASAVTLVGGALVLGPWLARLGGQVADERRERIRSEERAEMAAHLHDSVLQTLALIQRAETAEEVRRLARGQERELRTWLFGRSPDDAPTRLGQAVQDLAGRVEDRFGLPVDVVLAGEVPLDADLLALAEAAGEAMANAARHSGAAGVDVFVEVEPDLVTVFVRDEGVGFDPDAVGRDRRGLSHSIIDRVQRHGGRAAIHSEPGEGTEVELSMPLPTASSARQRPEEPR